MTRYRLTKPAYVAANGHPHPRHFKAGETIEVADDLRPAHSWIPLDDAAKAAAAKHQRPFDIMPNGVQARHRATGQLTGGASAPKRPGPVEPIKPRHVTPDDYIAERKATERDPSYDRRHLHASDELPGNPLSKSRRDDDEAA